MDTTTIARLNDEDLLIELGKACASARRCSARIIAVLVHVEDRRLHLAQGYPSMFEYCVRHLQMSDGEAFRRITASRLAARFPQVIGRIASGDLHLSNLIALRDHLTEDNVDELLDAVRGRSKMQVLEMLATLSPRPDAPSRLRKLPKSRTAPSMERLQARFEPLTETLYRLQVTLSRQGRDKLELARDLMRHRNVSGDLAVVIERALDALIEELEREILGKTSREAKPKLAKTAKIPRAVRREVIERDGYQCTFVSKKGVRCCAKTLLEIDHIRPRAKGGTDDASNLRVLCRAHNLDHAEQEFGRDVVRRKIATRQRA